MDAEAQYQHRWWVLFAVSFAVLLINVEITAVNLIIAPLSKALHISIANSHWIISAYLLTFSSLVVACGRLGDLIGHKKMLMLGVSVFVIASLIGSFAETGWEIMVCRVLQGVGAAIMWPSTTALAFKAFPGEQKGVAVGTIISVTGFSVAIGPTIGGYFASALSWRWVFFFNVPIGLIILLLGGLLIKECRETSKEKFDVCGLLLQGIGLVALIFAIDSCGRFQNGGWLIFGLLVISAIAFTAFIHVEKTVKHPLLRLDFFKNVQFTTGCLARAMLVSTFFPFLFIMGLYLQKINGFSVLDAGLIFLPLTLCIGFLSPIGGKLIDKIGARIPATAGLLVSIVGFMGVSLIGLHTPLYQLLIAFAIIGVGYSLATPAFLALTMTAVPEERAGIASAIFFMLSIFGGLVGVTVAGVLLDHYHLLFGDKGLLHVVPVMMWIDVGACVIGLVLMQINNLKKAFSGFFV